MWRAVRVRRGFWTPPPPGEGPRGRSRGVSRWAGAVALAAAVLVVVLAVSLWPAGRSNAASGVLVSNLDHTGLSLGELQILPGLPPSQSFRTGGAPGGYRLDSVEVLFGGGGDASSLTVTLHRGSRTGPVVATLEGPGTIANGEQVTFVAPAGTVLQPDSVYVLKMADPSGAPYLSLTTRDDPGVDAALEGWSIPDSPRWWLFAMNGGYGRGRLVSNTGVAPAAGVSELGVVDVGQVFVTGSHQGGYLLDSVGVRFDAGGSGAAGSVRASLHRVGAWENRSLVELGSVEVVSAGVVLFDEVPLGTLLAPDTAYVVLLEGLATSTVTVGHVSSGVEDAGGGPGWSLADWHGTRPRADVGSLTLNGLEGVVGAPVALEVFGVESHLDAEPHVGGASVTALGLEAAGSAVAFDQGAFDAATSVYSASVPAAQDNVVVEVEVADDVTGLVVRVAGPDGLVDSRSYGQSALSGASFAVTRLVVLDAGRTVVAVEAFKGAVSGTYAIVLERSDTPEGLGSAAPEVFFETLSKSVEEGDGAQQIAVALSEASPYPVRVGVAAAGGTAGPDDVVLAGDVAMIEPGETSGTFTLEPVDDDLIEPDETFAVSLRTLSGPATVRQSASTFELTVEDNEDVEVEFIDTSVVVGEDSGQIRHEVRLAAKAGGNPDAVLPVPVTVGWFTVEDTATPGEDYVGISGTVTFPAGAAVGDVVEVGPVQIVDDDVEELNRETFEFRIGAIGYSALARSVVRWAALVRIENDDGPPTMSVTDAQATEGDDLVFEATLSHATNNEVTATFTVTDGTATADVDYLEPTAAQRTVRFAAGRTTAQIRVGTVPDQFDGVPEGDETLTLTLSVPAGATLGTEATATGTIIDRPRSGGVAVTPQLVTVTEGGTATLRVRLGRAPQSAEQVSLHAAGAESARLTFSPDPVNFDTPTWDNPMTVTVTALQETPGPGGEEDRRDDTVTVSVLDVTGSQGIGDIRRLTVLVVDDDKSVPGVVGSLGASVGSGRVSLSWGVPVDDGGHDVDGYEYKYFPSATPAAEQDELFGWNWVPPTQTSVSVDGLANGQEYTFVVRARNRLGASAVPAARVSATPRAGTIVRPNRGGGGGGGSDVDVGVATFVVANGWSPSDVGVAAVLAARTDNAVTLYTGADVLPEATAALLGDARPAEVLIVGGTLAVSRDVRTQIRQASDGTRTVRITGADRAATAAAAARRVLGAPAEAGRVTLVVANGWSPPDIGAAAALAAGGSRTAVLYTRADALPDASAAVARDYDIARVIVVGGTAAVHDTAAAALSEAAGPDASLTRVTGTDRAATAAAAARRVLGPPAAAQDITLVVANGWSPPDIGAAAALAAALDNAAIAYTAADKLPASTEQLIADYQPTAVIIIGGPNAVTDQVRTAITQTAPPDTRTRRITGTDRTHTAANTAKHILRNR